jgi:hypothetical protein
MLLLVAACAALAHRSHGDAAAGMSAGRVAIVLAALGAVSAFSTRSGLFLLSARLGFINLAPTGQRRHRLLSRALPSALAGAMIGVACAQPASLFAASPMAQTAVLFLVGCCGVAIGTLLHRLDANRPTAPRPSTRLSYVALDTALPSAVVACAMGLLIAGLRWTDNEMVSPGSLARHLGGSTVLYALLLGTGAFLKTFSETRAGLVTVDPSPHALPGPILTGASLAVAILLLVPWLLPPLALHEVLVLKGVAGFVLGRLHGCGF